MLRRNLFFMSSMLLIFLMGFTPCFSEDQPEEENPNRIVVYKSATEWDYPPFSVTDDGEADGFSVDLLKAAADAVGIQIEFKVDQWSVIKEELKNGHLDVLPLVGYTEERDEYFDFTVPYIVMHGNIFVRDNNNTIRSEEDLYGKEIIVMNGDNAMEYATRKNFTDKLIIADTYTEAFKLLSDGHYDAVLAQNIVGQKIIQDHQLNNVKAVTYTVDDKKVGSTTINLDGFEQKFCFAVQEGNKELLEKLNEGLVIVSTNGQYEEIYNKWFPFMVSHKMNTKLIVQYILIVLVPVVVFFLIGSWVTIRREVKRKTKDLEKLNQDLMIQKEKAEAASMAKSQFLANMAHEIRTPMNGLMGMIQLLSMSELNEEQKKYIGFTKTSTELLMSVINDILDYSKIEAGMMGLDLEPIDLMQILQDVVNLYQLSANKKDISIEVIPSQDIPDCLIGDAFRLKQILSNLIGNGVKFTEHGFVRVFVEVKSQKNNRVELEFQIQDSGIGIPGDKMDILFKSFSQADNSNTRKFGGSGLGLAICKGLVEKMDGTIWVKSQEGLGSKFCFTCILDCPDHTEAETKFIQTKEKEIAITEKKVKILVVEDDPISSVVCTQLLQKKGWDFIVKTNGIEAIAAFESTTFDCILMDIQMPIMDGYTATIKIREIEGPPNSHTPIIGVTARVFQEDQEKCLEIGMDDILVKPFEVEEFYRVIERWLA